MNYFYKQINSGKFNKTTQINSPTSILGHELIHSFNFLSNKTNYYARIDAGGPVSINGHEFINLEEAKTTSLSSQINYNLGENKRASHNGIIVATQGVLSAELKTQ